MKHKDIVGCTFGYPALKRNGKIKTVGISLLGNRGT